MGNVEKTLKENEDSSEPPSRFVDPAAETSLSVDRIDTKAPSLERLRRSDSREPSDTPLAGTPPDQRVEASATTAIASAERTPKPRASSQQRDTTPSVTESLSPEELRSLLTHEIQRRKASEAHAAELSKQIDSFRQIERNDVKSQILESSVIDPGIDVSKRLTELQMEVVRLNQLLDIREKELEIKEERVRLLQEKLVDHLLSEPSKPKPRTKTTKARSRSELGSVSSLSRDTSPRVSRTASGRLSSSSYISRVPRGESPVPKEPRPGLARRAPPLVAGSPMSQRERAGSSMLSSSRSRVANTPIRTGPVTSTRVKTAVPAPAMSNSALNSARSRSATSARPSPKAGVSTSISSLPSKASPLHPSTRRTLTAESSTTTPKKPARTTTTTSTTTRATGGTNRSTTPLRSHPAGQGHPGMLRTRETSASRTAASAGTTRSPLVSRTSSAQTGSPGKSTASVGGVNGAEKAVPTRRAITPLHSTSPTRSLARSVYSGETTGSRQRPRISCEVGRHDATTIKGTTTTVTFKNKSAGKALATTSGVLSSEVYDFPMELSPVRAEAQYTSLPLAGCEGQNCEESFENIDDATAAKEWSLMA